MYAGRVKSSESRRPVRVSVAGHKPRPLAIGVVEERLWCVRHPKERALLAHRVAETCHECFVVENLFRELIECDAQDLDGILTALVNLDIQLRHIADHWRGLERRLGTAMRAVDGTLSKPRSRRTHARRSHG